jgi:hypothetical protein
VAEEDLGDLLFFLTVELFFLYADSRRRRLLCNRR